MTIPLLRVISSAVVALVLLATGCNNGPEIVPVSGQVFIDGKPLTHGFIQVAPKGFRAASGKIGADGRFTLTTEQKGDGCLVGTHPVAIIATESINPSSQRWHAPKKYQDFKTSNLTVSITGPTDSLKIELTWDGGKPFVQHFEKE